MNLNRLQGQYGRIKKSKRVGRGCGSGKGMHTTGRGTKGQLARTGGKPPFGHEGGQEPLFKRLPQIGGFKSLRPKDIVTVSLRDLNRFDNNSIVLPKDLVAKKIIKKLPKDGVKILANGELEKKLTLVGFLASKSALEILTKGGSKILESDQSEESHK